MTLTETDSPWWVSFFDERYRVSDLDCQPGRRTAEQIGCIRDILRGAGCAKVLDLCCGTGRHAVGLAAEGFEVTGVDLNPDYLELARQRAEREQVRVGFLKADMRRLEPVGGSTFDAVISLYTSFGFFPGTDGDQLVLAEIARVLRPSGTLVLDIINRDWLLRSFAASDFSAEQDRFVIRDYDDSPQGITLHEDSFMARDSTLRWTITRMTEPRGSIVADYRVYSVHEIISLLASAGFKPRAFLGGYDGSAFTIFSPRIIVVAEAGSDG